MGKVRWTEKASSNLQTIYDYIARDSKTYAVRLVRSLILATAKLETAPHCGRIVPELEGYGFEILAVIHGARDIKAVSRKEWEL